MRFLLTGAAGFLGSHVLSHLLQRGDPVTILLRASSNLGRIQSLLPQTQVIWSDFVGTTQVKEQIAAAQPEVVLHLAWTGGSSGRYQNDLTQIEDNLPGALNLLQTSAQAGARRWVGVGSAFEYGNLPGVLTEVTAVHPNTLYAISKYSLCLASEKMCALFDVEYVWVRPFAIYGIGDNAYGLIPSVTQALLRGECPALTGGEQNWDYLYVEDAARGLVQLALAPEARGIYNLAFGKSQTVRRLVELIRDQVDPSLLLGFGQIPYHRDQIMNLKADISKLKAAANWTPEITLAEGLKRIIDKFSNDKLLGLWQ